MSMAKDDPLDKTTSIGAELTKSGVKLNAKSRAVAALDRLLGNAFDFANIPIERRNVEERAKMEAGRQLVDAIRDHALSRLETDPEFADRVTRNYLDRLIARQQNKDGVVRHAIEDLRRNPQAEDGGDSLDPPFLNKFERHAEDATTEQLREKWGRVLAAEIRKPGTFSAKVLRVVDELDPEMALRFEQLCQSRMANMLPTYLVGDLPVHAVAEFVEAGLLVEPSLGKLRMFRKERSVDGTDIWFNPLGMWGIGLKETVNVTRLNAIRGVVEFSSSGELGIPGYMLTSAGLAVSSILPDNTYDAFQRLVTKFREIVGEDAVIRYERKDGEWRPTLSNRCDA
jgi:hypothetical protein